METDMTREEAIKELRGFIGQLTEGCQEAIKVLIPELRESEDEKIRKEMVAYFSQYKDDGIRGVDITPWIAYLEKQKEQKPVERSLEDDHIIGFVYDLLNEIEWKDNWAMSKDECLRLLSNYSPQKPVEWSEKDRNMLNSILLYFNAPFHDMDDIEKNMFIWLQSLPERFNLESKQEWSEEDEALFELLHQCVCRCINDDRMAYSERDKISKTMIPFIEKLQTLHPQQQAICDEKYVPSREMILAIWELGNEWKETNPTGITQREYIQKHWKESSYYDKLKSTNLQPHTVSIRNANMFAELEYERGVKDGIQHAKNHQWKPSEEQIDALRVYLYHPQYINNSEDTRINLVESLYNDLKKLM